MKKNYSYICAISKDQNEDKQLAELNELLITEMRIYVNKKSDMLLCFVPPSYFYYSIIYYVIVIFPIEMTVSSKSTHISSPHSPSLVIAL